MAAAMTARVWRSSAALGGKAILLPRKPKRRAAVVNASLTPTCSPRKRKHASPPKPRLSKCDTT